jgi:hypothetical protein
MNLESLLQYKALHQEYVLSGQNQDMIFDALSPEDKKKHLRNVCALIALPLFDELEHTCGLLEISKRLFIESAIIDALAKAAEHVTHVEALLVDASSDAQQVERI